MSASWRNDESRQPTAPQRTRERVLRRALTEPEKRLWWHLRRRLPLEGTHFRRQVPIGPYIADFCCLPARLIVEVDGGQHSEDEARRRDDDRTAYLNAQGFRVLRFWNHEVMTGTDSVIETIAAALATPTPCPSPQGGGEERLA